MITSGAIGTTNVSFLVGLRKSRCFKAAFVVPREESCTRSVPIVEAAVTHKRLTSRGALKATLVAANGRAVLIDTSLIDTSQAADLRFPAVIRRISPFISTTFAVMQSQFHRFHCELAFTAIVVLSTSVLLGADKGRIDDAIQRGQSYLLKQPKSGPEGSLASYALIKSGIDKRHPDVQKCVDEIVTKFSSGIYTPRQHHNYEAGVDAMLLEAVDPVAHRSHLQAIASHLISTQNANGAWYYNSGNMPGYGDTSITQYAILGLWAALRADVDIPTETWEKTARWLMQTQRPDGGFVYQLLPGRLPEHIESTVTMNAAGTGTLLIIRHVLFGDEVFDDAVRPATATRRFGVLERLPDEKRGDKPKVRTVPTLSRSALDKSLKEGMNWMAVHFAERSRIYLERMSYYYYGVERVAALLDVEKIGTRNWYDEGSDELLLRQRPDGDWTEFDSRTGTALSILFLTKSTATVITKPKRAVLVGGGLLAGGRGLPDNLDAVQVKEGQIAARKLQGRVDGLLADLEKSSDAKVEDVQAAVVEAVQLDRPEDLIGQVDRLKKLATDTRVEVRRTAMWALGRTGNISVAPLLIRGLADVDESVMREASLGLSILSRKPEGSGLPLDPTDGLKEDASTEERQSHLNKWGKESASLWQKWYLKVRPYGERDDRTLLKRKS